MKLRYSLEAEWPAFTWLARCRDDETIIQVHHGPGVEAHDNWFCEANWDGDFERGDFDQTDIVFGSGGRLRKQILTLVSSASTCDRLQSIRQGDSIYVSNSLVCLAAMLDLQFDPWYPYYYEDLASINRGIDDYCIELDCPQGPIRLTYFRNLAWNGNRLREVDKPNPGLLFNQFEHYRAYLLTALKAMQKNMQSPMRHQCLTPITTCSTGYDSLAVTVLAREIDTTEAICVPQDRLDLSDSGVELVYQLGMQPRIIDRFAWRRTDFVEQPFIAADACGRDVWLQPAIAHLRGRVLFTGNYGDSAWSERQPTDRGPLFRSARTGPAGLSLAEFRLQAGFIHCPLPYIGTRALSASSLLGSDEMQPWRLGNRYDRPIPRRIVEEAGISRNSFGMRKTATAVHLFRQVEFERFFGGTATLRDYMRWIRQCSRDNPPPNADAYELTRAALETIEIPMFRHLFPWAIERCKPAYRTGVNSAEHNNTVLSV